MNWIEKVTSERPKKIFIDKRTNKKNAETGVYQIQAIVTDVGT
jgi:hypothetical protein